MNGPNIHAARYRHIEECRKKAIELMENSSLGQEAIEGMFYTEMFGWLSGQFREGRTPTGIPTRLREEWKLIGDFRRERGKAKKG